MKKVSFDEVGAVTATFLTGGMVRVGDVVEMAGDDSVSLCNSGLRFCGQALSAAGDGYAAVQLRGAVTVKYSGAKMTAGWQELTGDGYGGVRVADPDDDSRLVLVLCVDAAGKTVTVLL